MAAQDQAVRTNAIKVKLDKQEGEAMCNIVQDQRRDGHTHIISKCSELAQLEYKKRQNNVAIAVHWSLCETYHMKRSEQWYQHTAEPFIETESVKIL